VKRLVHEVKLRGPPGDAVHRGLPSMESCPKAFSPPRQEEVGPLTPPTKGRRQGEELAGLLSCEEALEDTTPTPLDDPKKPLPPKALPQTWTALAEMVLKEVLGGVWSISWCCGLVFVGF
jgi:hypothetical protein